MASLRDTVKGYQEELRDGIAWVAFWKTGRSWNAEYFHLEIGDYLYPEDRSRMEEIKQADPAAVVVNGYYSGYLGGDMNLDELTAGAYRGSKSHRPRCGASFFLKKPTGTAKNPTPTFLTGV